MEQIKPFEPQFHLKQQASALTRLPDGRWRLETDAGTVLEAPVVVIAAGAGSFVPRRLPLPGAERFRGHLAVLCRAQDGAVPWPADPGRRRRRFGPGLGSEPGADRGQHGAGASPRRFPRGARFGREDAASGRPGPHASWSSARSRPRGRGRDRSTMSRSRVPTAASGRFDCDTLLAFYGLKMELGPIAGLGPQPRPRPDRGRHRRVRDQPARDLRHRRHLHLSRQAQADPVRASTRRR